jgi:adenosylcobinamide-GDP ribazoletransferase
VGFVSRSARSFQRDLADALRFFTRLPLPASPDPGFDVNRTAWAAPFAGAIVGFAGVLALTAAEALGLPPLIGATLAVGALVAASGALHEDGLADVADGFGGGATRERKLAIMRDSRIGAFGAVALVLSLVFRIGALSAALRHGFGEAAGALTLAAAVSRAGALAPLALLDPARADGAGAAAGRLEPQNFAAACVAALAIALILGLTATGLGHALAGFAGAAVGTIALTALARRQIGGQTGDVAGAAQQAAEIAAWCGLLIGRSAA